MLWGVNDEEGLEKGKGVEGSVGCIEDNKRIRETHNNNISEFNYTEQHHC
jgi:hypothetical protein